MVARKTCWFQGLLAVDWTTASVCAFSFAHSDRRITVLVWHPKKRSPDFPGPLFSQETIRRADAKLDPALQYALNRCYTGDLPLIPHHVDHFLDVIEMLLF